MMKSFKISFIIILMLAGSYGTVKGYRRWLKRSDAFKIRTVQVTGNDLLSKKEILELGKVNEGDPTWEKDLSNIKKGVESYPFIESVDVRRVLPDMLKIDVHEKVAVALLKFDKELFCVDKEGLVLPSRPGRLYDLPIMSGDFKGGVREGSRVGGPMFEKGLTFINEILEEQPRLYPEISEIVLDKQGVSLYLKTGGIPVIWGNDDDALKMHSCYAMIQEIQEKKMRAEIAYIDLRFRGQVILGMRS